MARRYGERMVTAEQVRRIWTAPKDEPHGWRNTRIGLSDLAALCVEHLCQGMSDRGAAQWTNELPSRFRMAGQCLRYARTRRPRRVRNHAGWNFNLAPVGG